MGTYSPNSSAKQSKAVRKSAKLPAQAPKASLSVVQSPTIAPGKPSTAYRAWIIVGALAMILSAGGGAVGLAWLSYRLIVNPQAVKWVSHWVPGWSLQLPGEQPTQTLKEIRTELRNQGQTTGELIPLGKNQSFVDGKTPVKDWLVPIRKTESNCFANCDRIVELRVYQTAPEPPQSVEAEEQYYLVHQVATPGLEESFAIAPLAEATSANQGSSRLLPLTQLSRYEDNVPKQGVWLHLSGSRVRGDETIAYGQVLYYNPKHQHLSAKLSWTSPTAEIPVWKNVTGDRTPEVIVNQTIGMEPQFEIYEVKPQRFIQSPVQLEQISLSAAAVTNPYYESALLLARSRLWSTSLAWLQALKKRSPQLWTPSAEAQLALIKWHAGATATQADSSWASPSQQVLANLLDGRWERATMIFESSVAASQETVSVLKTDQGRLENRVKAALRINPEKLEIKAWGTLLKAVQQDSNTAIAWLQALPKTSPQDFTKIRTLMQRLDPNFSDFQPSLNTPEPSPSVEESSDALQSPEPSALTQ